jgi:hypothetical protein
MGMLGRPGQHVQRGRIVTDRERLPNRRGSATFDFEIDGLKYSATVSRFSDGRIGELFISNHKSNSSESDPAGALPQRR